MAGNQERWLLRGPGWGGGRARDQDAPVHEANSPRQEQAPSTQPPPYRLGYQERWIPRGLAWGGRRASAARNQNVLVQQANRPGQEQAPSTQPPLDRVSSQEPWILREQGWGRGRASAARDQDPPVQQAKRPGQIQAPSSQPPLCCANMAMKVSFIPSLKHLSCIKIVTSLFELELPLVEAACLGTSKLLGKYLDPYSSYKLMQSRISKKIESLTLCIPMQKKLQSFIDPLFCEIEDWLKFCENSFLDYDDMQLIILKTIPRCWSPDGSIDREKSAKILVKNNDISPTNRFIFACTFCLLNDVLDIWKILTSFAKVYLHYNIGGIIRSWIDWIESSSEKDCQSFIKWALEMQLCNRNVYILKYVSKTLSSDKKSQYLTDALSQKDVSCDIMCFGLSLMTRNEQEFIFKKHPVEVFKCIMSWPRRGIFYDIVNILMPYLICDTFCDILNILLLQIKIQRKDYNELLVILKKFWEKSPLSFKNSANNKSCISEPLQIVLDYKFTKVFPTQKFLDSFEDNVWSLTPFVIEF